MNLSDMTFGIEIECTIPYAAMQADNWVVGAYHVGAAIPGFEGWKAMRDGSVQSSTYTFAAVEVVSPVLRGVDGLANVVRMVAKLNAMGAKVNASCGFHVHVGFDGDVKSLVRLIALVANVEPALFAATGSRARVGNRYCKSIKSGFSGVRRGKSPESLNELRAKVYAATDRYHVLNLTNLLNGARPTVEFRVFAGTTNINKITGYIQLCLGLVQRAVEVDSLSSWDARGRQRTGVEEVSRLMAQLGWTGRNSRVEKAYGVIADEATMANVRKELVRLAQKFDGPRVAPARVAPVEDVDPIRFAGGY